MGKIHEALQRAEDQRARLGGPPGGPTSPQEILDRPPAPRERRGGARKTRAGELRAGRRARLVLNDSDSPISEQYRSLRARIQSIRRTQPIRTLAITSALAGEGKTTTAVNLAASFGLDPERSTCLVDADMRTPAVHRALSEPPAAGLAEVLEGDAKLEEALVQIPDTRLWVLPVRSLPGQPSELLGSTRMAELLEELEARFETVLVDSPPVLGLPDATTLVDLCDAAVLVVCAGKASRGDLESTLERIDGSKLLGTVFNGSDEKPEGYGPGAGYGTDRR
jgi:capsular exopolysaccharide synthesis family protein